MIGMSLSSFLTLFIISALCAVSLFNVLKPTGLSKVDSLLMELIVGWIGAWLGSPVLGHWSRIVPSTNIYVLPAILGTLAAIFACVTLARLVESLLLPSQLRITSQTSAEKARVA